MNWLTSRKATPSSDTTSNVGFDAKYGLTRGLTADLTVNTDFAQVEEDLQQVNLTRYSLFFAEKRDFFLEGQATYAFGGVSLGQNANPGDVPVMDVTAASLAVTLCRPAVFSVTENVPTPALSAESAGSVAPESVLVRCAVSVKPVATLPL